MTPSSSVRNLGLIFDDQLTFKDHIAKTAWSCRFALHNIRKIRPFLTQHAAQLLFQALVISRLDYCNALLAGTSIMHNQTFTDDSECCSMIGLQRAQKGPCHTSLSPCTGSRLQLASSSRHWCLLIEQPQAHHPPTSTHWWQSTLSDASWCYHREAQNHVSGCFHSPFWLVELTSHPYPECRVPDNFQATPENSSLPVSTS